MAKAPQAKESSESTGASTKSVIIREAKEYGTIVGGGVGLLWGVHLINVIAGYALNTWGIVPRTLTGLKGILFSPFLHGSWGHLFSNSVPLVVLSLIVMLRRKRDLLYVGGLSALTSGIGVWITGANGYTVGASGVIFGLFGYLVARGIFERKIWSILASVVTFLLYGGIIWGAVPTMVSANVSWQAHLFGLLGGIAAAKLLTDKSKAEAAKKDKEVSRARIRVGGDDSPKLSASSRIRDEAAADDEEAALEAELEAARRRRKALTK